MRLALLAFCGKCCSARSIMHCTFGTINAQWEEETANLFLDLQCCVSSSWDISDALTYIQSPIILRYCAQCQCPSAISWRPCPNFLKTLLKIWPDYLTDRSKVRKNKFFSTFLPAQKGDSHFVFPRSPCLFVPPSELYRLFLTDVGQ